MSESVNFAGMCISVTLPECDVATCGTSPGASEGLDRTADRLHDTVSRTRGDQATLSRAWAVPSDPPQLESINGLYGQTAVRGLAVS